MATLYWLGTTSTAWSLATNWTTSSTGGVSPPAAAPTTTDTAVFNSFSGGGVAAGSVVLGGSTTITSLNISGCPLITLSGAFAFSASGVSTYTGGSFTFSNNAVTFTGGFTTTSAASTGTVTFSNTGAVALGPVTFTSSGSNVTLSNTTTMTATTMLINGSGGTLRIANATTAIPSGLVTITSTGSVLTFAGGAVTLSGGLTVTSGSTAGAVNISNTGAFSPGTITFTSGGTNVTATNTTTLNPTGAVTVNGSAGILSLTNGTTQIWSAGLTFSSTGSNCIIGGTSVTMTTATISVPVGATGGTCSFQNTGAISGIDNITFASTSAVLEFTSSVTTLTISGVTNPLNVTGTPTNIRFNNTLLTFSGASTYNVKSGNCTMSCNVSFTTSVATLTSNLTTTGLVTNSGGLNLGVYTLTVGSLNVANILSWPQSASQVNITGTSGTILTTTSGFSKSSGGGNQTWFNLTGGGSTTRALSINATGADPDILLSSGTFALTGVTSVRNADFTGFTGSIAGALSVSGNLTFGVAANGFSALLSSLSFVGTGSFTSNGTTLPSGCNISINTAGITVTLADNAPHYNSRLSIWNGTINLNDKYLEVLSISQYNGSAGVTVNITINGGASSTGIIYIRGTGTTVSGPTTPFFGPYTGGSSTYTVTNNPTIIFEPLDANVVTLATVGVWCYSSSTDLLPSMTFKNSVGGLSYTASFAQGAPRVLSFTIDTNFTGTYSSGFDVIASKNIFIGANATLGTSASAGFTTVVASGTGTFTANQSILRPITISNTTTATTQLLTNVTSNQPFTLTSGTLDLNNKILTVSSFSSAVAGTRAIAFGTLGTIVTTGTGVVWNAVDTISVTGTSNVQINNATGTATTITSTTAATEANSINFYVLSGTYSLTISGVFKNLDFTGFAGTLPVGAAFTCYGDLTFSTGMAVTSGGTGVFTLKQPTLALFSTLTTNGKTIDHPITVSGSTTGTLVVNGALTMGSTATSIFTLTSGEVQLSSGASLTTTSFVSSGASARALTFTGNTVTITGSTTTAWSASGSNFTMSSDGVISMTGASAKTFAAGSFTYPLVSQDGAGVLTFTGASLYSTVTNTVNSTVVPTAILYTPLAIATTITIASPAVFTVTTGNSPPTGVPVTFTTTGALPTGLVVGTVYYVKNISATTFSVAATMTDALNGTNLIATSGTQSGTQTATFGNGVYNFSINGRSGTSFLGTGSISATTLTITATTITGLRIGSFVTGPNIVTPARITAFGTGTGGNGTYTITPSQTAASGSVTASNDISLATTTNGTKHYLSDPSGVISTVQYVGIRDSQALGGAIWFASNESNDYGNNTGWYFVQATANFLMFMP